jgi:hypothetical protein
MNAFAETVAHRYNADQSCNKELVILLSILDKQLVFHEIEHTAHNSFIHISNVSYDRIGNDMYVHQDISARLYPEAVRRIKTLLLEEFLRSNGYKLDEEYDIIALCVILFGIVLTFTICCCCFCYHRCSVALIKASCTHLFCKKNKDRNVVRPAARIRIQNGHV